MLSARENRYGPAILFAGSAALLLGALGFQFLGGLPPCPLCLIQRYPHDAVLVLAAAAFLAPAGRFRLLLMLLTALALAAAVVTAGFHVGVEQKWWEGLATCKGETGSGELSFDQMRGLAESRPPPRCDEVPFSLFGISLAGYNFIFSLALLGYAVRWSWGAWRKS